MDLKLLVIPAIGAMIGWLTNMLAIKMLFWPYKPIMVPLLNLKIQGVIPKRQDQLAKNLGEIVEQQLLCVDDVIEQVSSHEITGNFQESAKTIIKDRIMQKVPSFLPISFRKLVGQAVEEILNREMPKIVDQIMDKMVDHIREDLKVAPVVEDKVNNYDMVQLERLIMQIASKELKHIEVLGGVLGFIIGWFQLAFIYFIGT